MHSKSPRSRFSLFPLAIFLVLLPAVAGVAAAGEPSRLLDLDFAAKKRLPAADALHIQATDAYPDLGNTLVAVSYDRAGLEQLKQVQGQADHLLVGAGARALFRDDGRGADDRAGDGVFHGVVTLDAADLVAKADAERAAMARGGALPLFDGREKVGSLPIDALEPIDVDAFLAGEPVEVRRSAFVAPEGTDLRVPGTNAFQEAVLMIRQPPVINDPARTFDPCTGAGTALGPWTFGNLMIQMANQPLTGIDPRFFTENWIREWLIPQTINTFNVPPRPAMNALLNDWRAFSGGGPLDLRISPFRLIAIVNRVDLRNGADPFLGPFTDAGEGRFVFGVVVPGNWPSNGMFPGFVIPGTNGCKALPFSVIFEYGIPLQKCKDVRDWARKWRDLTLHPYGSPTYLKSLQLLTDFFSLANADPSKPNGSAINQVRTNEIALAGPWELREFHVDTTGMLNQTTTADTPHDSHNGTNLFSQFVTGGGGPVPLTFMGQPFLGANPLAPTFWNGPGLIPGFINERFQASLATCNACHTDETGTPFVHVDPETPGLPVALSTFLTGMTGFPDPATGGPPFRDFDALEAREADINALTSSLCASTTPITAKSWLATGERAPDDLFDTSSSVSFALEDLLREAPKQVH